MYDCSDFEEDAEAMGGMRFLEKKGGTSDVG